MFEVKTTIIFLHYFGDVHIRYCHRRLLQNNKSFTVNTYRGKLKQTERFVPCRRITNFIEPVNLLWSFLVFVRIVTCKSSQQIIEVEIMCALRGMLPVFLKAFILLFNSHQQIRDLLLSFYESTRRQYRPVN